METYLLQNYVSNVLELNYRQIGTKCISLRSDHAVALELGFEGGLCNGAQLTSSLTSLS